MSELGISAGSLDLITPVEYWDINSGYDIPTPCTEIHCYEIGALVSHDTLYRDTSYLVVLPGDMDFMSNVLSHVRGLNSFGVDPWDFLRRHLSVSLLFQNLFWNNLL